MSDRTRAGGSAALTPISSSARAGVGQSAGWNVRWVLLSIPVAVLAGLVFLRAPLPAVLLAASALLFGAVLRYPDLAIYAVLFLLYSNVPAVGVAFHGVPRPVAAAFPLLLAVPLVRELLLQRRSIVVTPVLVLMLVFLGVELAGMAFSRDPGTSLDTVTTFAVEGIALYLLITNVLRSKETLRGATWALLAAGVLMSVVPLFQQFTGTFASNYGGLAQVDGGGFATGAEVEEGGSEEVQARLAGPIGEKNRYAQVMLVLVPLGLWGAFGARSRALRIAAAAATACIGLGFVLAFSRGGAVGMGCMLVAMLALRMIDARKALFLVAGLALLLLALPQYWTRLATIGSSVEALDPSATQPEADGAVRRRVTEMLAAVRVFIDHPVIGVGPGLFKFYAEQYGNEGGGLRRIEGSRRAHSLYLEVAAETGVVGLVLFLAMIAATLVGLMAARRVSRARDPELADLATAYFLALVCYLGTGVFLHLSYMRYFYVVLALGGTVAHLALRARPEAEPVARPALAGGGAA